MELILPTEGDQAVQAELDQPREELFPALPGEDLTLTDVATVMEALRYRKYWAEKREALVQEMAEVLAHYSEWYQRRITRCEERARDHEQNIENFLRSTNQTKLSTPEGTPYLATRTRVVWPADAELIEFAKATDSADLLIRVKESPDKTAIKNYIKTTGSIPEGYEEIEETSLVVKKA